MPKPDQTDSRAFFHSFFPEIPRILLDPSLNDAPFHVLAVNYGIDGKAVPRHANPGRITRRGSNHLAGMTGAWLPPPHVMHISGTWLTWPVDTPQLSWVHLKRKMCPKRQKCIQTAGRKWRMDFVICSGWKGKISFMISGTVAPCL